METIVKAKRITYRDRIEDQKEKYNLILDSLSEGLKNRLDSYSSALKGEFQYTDSHTGKKVKARTYNKRLEFAERELSRLQTNLALQKRYGMLTDDQAIQVSDYIHSLYDIAITNNNYVKKKEIKKRAPATKVRQRIRSLDDKIIVEQARSIEIKTGYTDFATKPLPEKSERVEQEQTSSPLYNRLREIDSKHQEYQPRIQEDDAKLKDDDIPSWPFSREEIEQMQRRRMEIKPKIGWKRVFAGIGAGIAALGITFGALYSNLEKYSVPELVNRPEYRKSVEIPVQSQQLTEQVQQIKQYTSIIEQEKKEITELIIEPLSQDIQKINRETEELAKQRAKAAIQKIKAEKESLENRLKEGDRKQEQAEVEDYSFRTKSPSEIILSFWDKKSRERAQNQRIVKEVVYYPNGKVEVNNFSS